MPPPKRKYLQQLAKVERMAITKRARGSLSGLPDEAPPTATIESDSDNSDLRVPGERSTRAGLPATATTAAPPTQPQDDGESGMDISGGEESPVSGDAHSADSCSFATPDGESPRADPGGGLDVVDIDAADEAVVDGGPRMDASWVATAQPGDWRAAPAPFEYLRVVLLERATCKAIVVCSEHGIALWSPAYHARSHKCRDFPASVFADFNLVKFPKDLPGIMPRLVGVHSKLDRVRGVWTQSVGAADHRVVFQVPPETSL